MYEVFSFLQNTQLYSLNKQFKPNKLIYIQKLNSLRSGQHTTTKIKLYFKDLRLDRQLIGMQCKGGRNLSGRVTVGSKGHTTSYRYNSYLRKPLSGQILHYAL